MKKVPLLLFSLFFISTYFLEAKPSPEKIKKVTLNKKNFTLEIAATPYARSRGLMFRKDLCASCGMLFIFEKEEKQSFWMKNTLIPLDLVFINKKKKVVDKVSLKPCKKKICVPYHSRKKSLFVLEVNAGTFTNVIGKKIIFLYK